MRIQNRIAVAGAGLAYGLMASGTIFATHAGSGIATIWPPNAILLAMLWTLPKHRWTPYVAVCFADNILANVIFRGSLLESLPFAIVNIGEVLLAAQLLGRARDSSEAFGGVGQVVRFGMVAGLIAPGAGALFGGISANVIYASDFGRSYATWFGADALGLLIVTPIALMVRDGELLQWYRQLSRESKSRSALLFSVVILSAVAVFAQSRFPFLFLVFGPTILAACRLGRVGAVISVLIVAAIGTVSTLQGGGPISLIEGDDWTQVIIFQVFLAALMMTALPAAAELDERRQLIARLAEREAALLLLMERSSDLILNFDRGGNCIFASGSGSSLAAYSAKAVVGANVVDLPHPADAVKAKANHEAALRHPATAHRCEYRMSNVEGKWFWVEASTRALTDADGRVAGTVSALRDVSHHKRREADLRMAATTDQLTGIANRAGFMKAFEHVLAQPAGQECWLGLLDIDHFKAINDRHGHLAGDEVLRMVTERLGAELRTNDIVGRVGGEEFGVLLVGCSEETASQVFERLRETIAGSAFAVSDELLLAVTLSAGFVKVAPQGGKEYILAAADEALYFSKRSGRDRVTLGMTGSGAIAA